MIIEDSATQIIDSYEKKEFGKEVNGEMLSNQDWNNEENYGACNDNDDF